MFLISKKTWLLAFYLTACFATLQAHAQKRDILEVGHYRLIAGPQELCGPFSILPQDLEEEILNIGSRYSFITQDSSRRTESDLDANCEFREQSKRDDTKQDELTLTRLNEEACGSKIMSRTLSTLTIHPDEIQLIRQITGAPSYVCVWKKQ